MLNCYLLPQWLLECQQSPSRSDFYLIISHFWVLIPNVCWSNKSQDVIPISPLFSLPHWSSSIRVVQSQCFHYYKLPHPRPSLKGLAHRSSLCCDQSEVMWLFGPVVPPFLGPMCIINSLIVFAFQKPRWKDPWRLQEGDSLLYFQHEFPTLKIYIAYCI